MSKKINLLVCFVLLLGLAGIASGELIVHWRLDETSGNTAFDSSGNVHDGTVGGTANWVAGRFDGGLSLNETSNQNYIDLNTQVVSGTFSFTLWINAHVLPYSSGYYAVLHNDAWNAGSIHAHLRANTSLYNVEMNGGPNPTATTVMQQNQWYHCAYTVVNVGGTNTAHIYIDTVLEATATGGNTGYLGPLNFGAWRDGGDGRWVPGIMDDIRIYDHELTQTEIDEIYLGGDRWKARNPDPAHLAVDVPIDANLNWTRGDGAVKDEVYFGTDPCAANLPLVAQITVLPINPPRYNPPADLVASTTYYWQIVEVNGIDRYEGPVWQFETIRGEARPDFPFDGAIITGDEVEYMGEDYIWTKLIFYPGPTAVSHVGYFHKDYSKVDSRDPCALLGPPPYGPPWQYTLFAGNPQVPPANQTLVRGTKYYWTVDATDALSNTFAGDVWAFAIQGFKAFEPSPPNEAIYVSTTPYLSWLPGFGVVEHDIYMGTNKEDVNNARYDVLNPPPEFVKTRLDPNYQIPDVNSLPYSTKIYWRVDQVNGRSPFAPGTYYYGDVWEFTTLPEGVGEIRADFWWTVPGGDSLDLLYAHPNFPGNPDEIRMLPSFDSTAELANQYGGMIHGWLHPAYSGDYTFWLCSDDDSELYLSTDETPANMVLIANIDGWAAPYQWDGVPGAGTRNIESVPIPLVAGQKYYIRACWKEGGGGDHCQVAWQGPDQPLAPVDGSASAVIPGSRLEPFLQLWAHSPSPRHWEYPVPVLSNLKWGPGDHALLHDVYFGTDKGAVESATTSSTGIYQGRIGPNSLSVLLDAATFYYWRVDEVNLAGPDPCLWKGTTWTFRTEGAAGGLLGLYYHWDGYQPDIPIGPPNPFQVFVMSRIEPQIDWNFGSPGSPDPNINDNYFACKWVGHVEAPVDANYTFSTQCDDGARLIIDGQEVIPTGAWSQGGMRWFNGDIMLSAGLHDIEMHMYEREGGAGARLAWSAIPTNPSDYPIFGLSASRQIIPSIWLWPPLFASGPRPPDGATVDDRTPALEWIPGVNADKHELYFSANFDDVNNRTATKETVFDPCRPYPPVPRLQLGETYYWLVDEVKNSPPGRWNARTVWSFTISECLSLDNMEDYNDRGELRRVWRDGNADVVWSGTYPYLTLAQGGSSGSNLNVSTAVGSPIAATGPVPPGPLNDEAMVLRYDNDGWTYVGLPSEEKWIYDAPYYSEIEANTVGDNSLDVGQTWDSEGIKSLSLTFQGHPVSDGSYNTDLGWPAYTVYGRGRDIWNRHDEFYFFGKYPFIGAGSIQAEVRSVENTSTWAKAGIMIREKRTPYSKFAAVFITPGQGVAFQYRINEDTPAITVTKPGVTAPQFVRLVRNISGAFEAKHSDNKVLWHDVNAPNTEPVFPEISMGTIDDPNIYVGTAVTSHNGDLICRADFNDLQMSPLPPNWVFGNIGTNDPEQLYVALSDGTNTSVVEHNDVNAATLTSWQEWNIALTDFTTVNPALNLDGIQKVYLGLGDRDDPCLGGSGAIYVDDIRACPPRCVPAFAQMAGDIAQPYDCTVDEKDVRVFAADYLLQDDFIASVVPSGTLVAHWPLDTNYDDYSGNSYDGTPMGGASLITDFDRDGVVSLASDGDYVDCGNPTDPCALDFGTGDWTVSAWFKTTMTGTGGDGDKGVIYGKGGDMGGGHRYGLYVNENQNPAGHVNLIIDDNAGDGIGSSFNKIQFTGDVFVSDGEWHHAVGMRDGNDLNLYIDGLPDGSATLPAGYDLVGTHQHNAYIGAITNHQADPNGTVVYKYLQGSVDDVRVYGYALSEGEVAYLATDGATGIHFPINSPADLYQDEPQGSQWINFKDYSLIADQYLEKLLWPTP